MEDMNNLFVLAGNGSYLNRGCEAIVRGTVVILNRCFNNPRFVVVSFFKNREHYIEQKMNEIDPSIQHIGIYLGRTKRFSIKWWEQTAVRFIYPSISKYIRYKDSLSYLDKAKAVLSVGGDNYSLDYGIPKLFTDFDSIVLNKKKPLILWGASIGPFSSEPRYEKYMINHLKKMTIFARESATIEYLFSRGLTKNVYHVADPAFLMEPTKPIKEGMGFEIEEGAIGINLSPLLSQYITNNNIEIWIKKTAAIISSLSNKIERTLYLIPHASSPDIISDYLFLQEALSLIKNNKGRIILIPQIFSASEIKWIISKMSLFIGTRTHSLIAALSSYVPTLSIAYSIKTIGINKDIFGNLDYCIDINRVDPEYIVEKTFLIQREKDKIVKHLQSTVPKIQRLSMKAGDYLLEILKR